jgi:hypothetical protein
MGPTPYTKKPILSSLATVIRGIVILANGILNTAVPRTVQGPS